MKHLFLILLAGYLIPGILVAQESEQKLKVSINGYIANEMYFDTYNSATSRDGQIYFYPLPEDLDANGDDLNKNFQAQMLAIQSRTRLTLSGLEAFGAKATGAIEGDFLGTTQDYTRHFRLRHAFIKLNWQNAELLTGQFWHPMFVTGCFPGVFSFGAGAPFNPLNRAPQVRYTYQPNQNISLMGAALFHGDFRSSGPLGAQQNSGLPDMQFQMIYKNDFVFTGFTAGYKFLTPRTETEMGVKTSETIGSYNLQAFAKFITRPVTIKLQGAYGQNMTNYVMIGGYGAAEDPLLPGNDDYSYINKNTVSLWAELLTNFEAFNAAIFAGYSSNLGASDNYFSLDYARGENIDYIFRISPRVQYSSGPVTLILEHMMTGAAYATNFDENYKPTESDSPTINHRVIFAAKYSF
ncbi:MAG: hypothetical protein R6V16_06615 [Bacteroidales bacterium]